VRKQTRLRYAVVIFDCGLPQSRLRIRHGLTLRKAWRSVRQAARRGFNHFGGGIAYGNWGGRGGMFPTRYRAAFITIDGDSPDCR